MFKKNIQCSQRSSETLFKFSLSFFSNSTYKKKRKGKDKMFFSKVMILLSVATYMYVSLKY